MSPDTPPPVGAKLVPWLQEHAGAATWELPLHVEEAEGARQVTVFGTDAVVHLDTTALSRTFDDHLAEHCTAPCDVWMRGTWGPLVGGVTTEPTFTVRQVTGVVQGTPTSIRKP